MEHFLPFSFKKNYLDLDPKISVIKNSHLSKSSSLIAFLEVF